MAEVGANYQQIKDTGPF